VAAVVGKIKRAARWSSLRQERSLGTADLFASQTRFFVSAVRSVRFVLGGGFSDRIAALDEAFIRGWR
jgi:hypothetical protein